jgi:hypothetical protein
MKLERRKLTAREWALITSRRPVVRLYRTQAKKKPKGRKEER